MEDLIENESEEKYVSKCQEYYSKLIYAKTYDEFISFANNKDKLSLPKKDINPDICDLKKQITSLANDIKEYLIYPNEEFIKNNYSISCQFANTLINIVEDIYKRFMNIKKEKQMFSFTDVAKSAIKIFKEYPDIATEIRESLNEIMIDEYQDTSNMQETFISYISNNNLYMVGDIKQSIYRFRYANPDLFKQKYLDYKKHNGGYLIDLNTNFRSRSEVLTNINEIFSLIMDIDYGGADYKNDHIIEYGNKSFLEDNITNQDNNLIVYNYDSKDYLGLETSEIEAFIVANDIKDKLNNNYLVYDSKNSNRKATYKDFTILVDKRSDFDTYKKVLESFSLPVCLYQNQNIVNQDDIYCFNSILVVIKGYVSKIYDSDFKHAFYSLAKSYLYSYSDKEILEIIVENNYLENSIYISLKDIIDNIENLSITNLFKEIITKTNWYNKLIYKGDVKSSQARLTYLISLSQNLDSLGYNFYEVIEYFKNINEKELEIVIPNNNSDDDAIKIMTIHNSKGLEFPICYFLGFDNSFNIDETKDNFIINNDNLILPFIDNNIKYHNLEWFDYKQAYLKDEISEKIRLLYVALTRAKEKMIIPLNLNNSTKKSIGDSRSFADFIIKIKDELYNYVKPVIKEDLSIDYNYKIHKYKHDIQNNLKDFSYIKIENNKQEKQTQTFSKQLDIKENDTSVLDLGNKLHNILFQLDFNNPNLAKYDSSTQSIINRFLTMNFLDISNSINIYKEFEFINDDKHGVIDLIIEYENEYKIIDYKLSNIDDPKYVEQLNGYKTYLQQIVNKPIKLYLYSLLRGKYKMID